MKDFGCGALAERALAAVLDWQEEFPYAIRTVSDDGIQWFYLQASICASTLSLMAAGVPIKAPVAGISAVW